MSERKIMKSVIETDDLVADLRRICYTNTTGYRSDFDKDEEIILSEISKPEGRRKTLVWMSHPNGTHLFYEDEVFLDGSPANITWLFYDGQLKEARKLAYVIWLGDIKDGKIAGVLYELDYEVYCKHLRERMVASDYIRYIYENGNIECSATRSFHNAVKAKAEFGELLKTEYLPNDTKKHLITVSSEQLCRDGSKVRLYLQLKEMLEHLWRQELEGNKKNKPSICLRCGSPLDKKLSKNAKSRYADCYICSECGMDEALRDYPGSSEGPLNFTEWEFYRQMNQIERKTLENPGNQYLLTSRCEFGDVFKKRDQETFRPISEAVYSRSDYDGYRWYTKWFLNGSKIDEMLFNEAEGFMDALWAMPAFKNLYSLRRACSSAELTSSPTEYNLYCETYHFYIWIRVNTRPKDYNLYVHYYRKNMAEC